MWYSFVPTKVRQVSFAINLSIRNSIIVMAADMEEVLTVDMQHWRDARGDPKWRKNPARWHLVF